jgi:hypothetical protein
LSATLFINLRFPIIRLGRMIHLHIPFHDRYHAGHGSSAPSCHGQSRCTDLEFRGHFAQIFASQKKSTFSCPRNLLPPLKATKFTPSLVTLVVTCKMMSYGNGRWGEVLVAGILSRQELDV